MYLACLRCLALLIAASVASQRSAAQQSSAAPSSQPARPILRIVADPNNLPFSNDQQQGFENKIAELIASDLNATIEYTWWAQRRGFFRDAVKHGTSDIVMGVPGEMDRVLRTRPYLRSSYVFVYRANATDQPRSFDDPALRKLKIGVPLVGGSNNSPPAQALANRGIVDNIVGYSLYTDYRQANPPSRIISDIAEGKIDVAIVWGPLAGYFARKQRTELKLVPVAPDADPSTPFAFNICIGVKRSMPELKDQIDRALLRHHAEIDRILDDFGVPRLAPAPDGR